MRWRAAPPSTSILILMDLNMPGMDGFATTALIRSARERSGTRACADRRADCARRGAAIATSAWTPTWTTSSASRTRSRIAAPAATLARSRRRCCDSDASAVAESTAAAAQASESLASVDDDCRRGAAASSARAFGDFQGSRAGRPIFTRSWSSCSARLDASRSAQLEAALERDDLPAAAAVCHKLASSAANVGALVYAQAGAPARTAMPSPAMRASRSRAERNAAGASHRR